jgi:hypothetical protein
MIIFIPELANCNYIYNIDLNFDSVWKTELTNISIAECGCCPNPLVENQSWLNHSKIIIFAHESWINFKYHGYSNCLETEDIPNFIKKYIALL